MQTASLAENIAAKIIELIQTSHLSTGEKIPTELQLAEKFGVSRATIREAEKLLRSRNVLEIRQGAGAFVSPKRGVMDDPLGFATVRDRYRLAYDLMAVRINLEPFVSELAALNATRDDLRRLWDIQTKLENDFDDESFESPEFEQTDLSFHISVANASHNLAVRRVTLIVEEAFAAIASVRSSRLNRQDTISTHRAVLEAIENRDSVGARNSMLVHLMLAEMFSE